MSRRSQVCLIATLILLVAAGLATAVAQQDDPPREPVSRIVDRSLGEEEQILKRQEWFFSTRRAGTESGEEMAELWRSGVDVTRDALRRQRFRRSAGIESEVNFWVPMGPAPSNFGGWAFGTVSGRISSLAADWAGGTLYAGSASGGLWKSTNDGLSWTNLFDDGAGTQTVGTVEVDPNDANVIWAGTGENVTGCEGYFGVGLLRSGDGGLTWEARNGSGASTLEDLSSFANIVIDPRDSDHLITGGRMRGCSSGSEQNGALYTSNDGGLTWTKRLDNMQVYEIVQDPLVLDTYWAATNTGVYKSVDNGVTWLVQTASGLPNGNTGRTELAVSPSDSNVVYALFSSGGNTFWRTTDGGASWTQMASGSNACDGQCWYNSVLRVHRTDPDIVYRGNVHVFKSLDGGANWTDLSNNWGSSQKVHQDTHEFLMDPNDPETFYVGCDGGVWKSEDGGANFLNRNGDMNVTQFYAIGVDANNTDVICGGAQDNSSLVRTSGNVWDLQAVTGDGFVCHVNPQDPNYSYITSYPSGGYPNVLRSTSGVLGGYGGITGSGSGIQSGDRSNWVTPYLLDPQNPSTLYIGTHRVYRSDDHGDSWDQVGPTDLTAGSSSLLSLAINRNFPEVLLSGSVSGRVWRTVNGGFAWEDITSGLPGRSINDVASDPADPDRAFAVVGGFNTNHVWEWNAGSGWTARGNDLPNVPVNSVLMLGSNDILVGTDTGVFRSMDGGVTFSPFMNGLPQGTVVTDLKLNIPESLVTAGTYGRGAWQVSIDPVEPMLLYDSIELPLTELDGDGDGSVEPGETWGVRPILRNAGGQTATGVTARLVSPTAGINMLDTAAQSFGDIAGGGTAPSQNVFSFSVHPAFSCGDVIRFDLLDVSSSNAPASYPDRIEAFTVTVVGEYDTPIPATLLDENFDGSTGDWTHEAVGAGVFPCGGIPYIDEWGLGTKDAGRGPSYHCGNGAGGSYSTFNHSWLYYGGKDSQNGPGIDIPADAFGATLTIEHLYDTVAGQDGGKVVIDADEDDLNNYETLEPEGGYPGSTLGTFQCNAIEGEAAFQGSSGGWVTSTFDLSDYVGKRVYLAFVFGSDRQAAAGEGWWIDQVNVTYQVQGAPICDTVQWPGSVPATVSFRRLAGGDIEASWAGSCNAGALPGQSYSVQAGDLSLLHSSGTYSHAPVGGDCARTSPAVWSPGSGSEYYLVVPTEATREGGAGLATSGQRPQVDGTCGVQRIATCP
ncbi:hypothetical protein ABI59_09895 [Acidobacteria bacterium Mor1]|nr:hypothetical protein ABI59_09895 [Acidobacteria bacterium Mor1]